MAIEIKMPNLSQTTDEVKLINWVVKVGDEVEKGDILCEVETDKVNMEVESFAEGTVLKILYEPDDMISSGEVIAYIGSPGEIIEEEEKEEKEEALKEESEKRQTPSRDIPEKEGSFRATKLVRNMALKKGIDLSKINGSGPRGTIVREDLEKYMDEKEGQTKNGKKKVIELSSNRLAVSANITKSKKDIPHYYLNTIVKAGRVLDHKNKGLSIDACIISCTSKAIKDFPQLNSTYKDKKIHLIPEINIGFAVAKDDELFVPVIKEADKMNIGLIDKTLKELVRRVKSEEVSLNDVSAGTVTISNLGIYDIDSFYGVINYPQALLITIGRIKKEVFVEENNSMVIRDVFNLSASFDHRIANGAIAAKFLTRLKSIIEKEI